jgi:hypothetical protein
MTLGGAMPGLVLAVERAVAALAAAGVALLLGATAVAFVAYVVTGVRKRVAWRGVPRTAAHSAFAGSLGAAALTAGLLAAALVSLALV